MVVSRLFCWGLDGIICNTFCHFPKDVWSSGFVGVPSISSNAMVATTQRAASTWKGAGRKRCVNRSSKDIRLDYFILS